MTQGETPRSCQAFIILNDCHLSLRDPFAAICEWVEAIFVAPPLPHTRSILNA